MVLGVPIFKHFRVTMIFFVSFAVLISANIRLKKGSYESINSVLAAIKALN